MAFLPILDQIFNFQLVQLGSIIPVKKIKNKIIKYFQFLSDKVTKTTRMKLRDHTSSNAISKEAPQDNIYVIESILGTKKESGVTFFKGLVIVLA